jgi:cell division protein FtsB
MDFEGSKSPANPQTEKFLVWASVLLFFGVLGFVYSTYQSEQERLAALQANEEQKEKNFNSLERQREQTARYIDRFSRDPEFVRDQARERLGVAEEGEVVIRVDGASSLSQPTPANSPAKPASP